MEPAQAAKSEAAQPPQPRAAAGGAGKQALLLLTSCARAYNGEPTGWHLLEVAHAWAELKRAGYTVEYASLKGGAAPMDPESHALYAGKDDDATAFLADAAVGAAVARTFDVHKLAARQQGLREWALVFVVGGHGTMMDMPADAGLGSALTAFLRGGGAVGAVSHGVAALLLAVARDGATPLLRGQEVTCWTNAEEEQQQTKALVPWLLENKLRELGARFTCAGVFAQHVAVAPAVRVVTGQVGAHCKGAGAWGATCSA